MVERILNWLGRELNGLHQAALLLGLSSLASQFLALIRDRLLASKFGAGQELDVYYAAFRLPDLVYVSIASFVSVTVLIPLLLNFLEKDRPQARQFLSQVFTAFIVVMIVVSFLLLIFAPFLTKVVAPGFSASQQADLTTLTRIMLLSPFLLGLSNLLGAVTQSLRKFFIYALSPLLYNIGIIVGILWFYPRLGLPGLAWGVILGASLHLAIQLPTIIKSGLTPYLNFRPAWSELRRVVVISLPRTLALSANQLSLLLLIAFASFLGAGSVAIFNLSMNLHSVPLAVIGVSYSVAAFPTLAQLFSRGEVDRFLVQITVALRHIIFWAIPATALLIVLRAQIVRVILGAGNFGWSNTRLTAAALALFALALVGQSIILLLARGYYACGRTRAPLVINILSAILIAVLALFLLFLFKHNLFWRELIERLLRVENLSGTAILMLPLSFSLGVTFNAILLWRFFQRDFGHFGPEVSRSVSQSIISSLVAGIVSYQTLTWLVVWFDQNTFLGIFLQGLIAGALGLSVLFLTLKYFNNQELAEIGSSLKRKFWRVRVIAPEQEGL